MIYPELLTKTSDIQTLAQELLTQEMIALDTEFIRENTFYPKVCLIQVATKKDSWIIDPLNLENNALDPFLKVLAHPKIIKVMHASQADQECFYVGYGVTASPSFDTAMAASLCGFGDHVGLSKLTYEILGQQLQKGNARSNWIVRPLPEQLKNYAHMDVQYLVELAKKLFELLKKNGRTSWAFELSSYYENKKNYILKPDAIALRLAKARKLDRRDFKALKKLVEWREKQVSTLNIPRRWLADDEVLLDLARVRPKTFDHLAAFRGLSRHELKTTAEALLKIFQEIENFSEENLPEAPKNKIPSSEEARAAEFVYFFVKLFADQNNIAPRHLIASEDVLPLLRRQCKTTEDLLKSGLMTKGAVELIGETLLQFFSSKIHLSFKQNLICIDSIKNSAKKA